MEGRDLKMSDLEAAILSQTPTIPEGGSLVEATIDHATMINAG